MSSTTAAAFAAWLTDRCADVLGADLVASYLHGSLVLGDFTPGRSDVDLLLVVERPLTDAALAALRAALDPLPADSPGRVDLRLVTRAVAAAPTPKPSMEAYFGLRLGRPPEIETRVAEPDLVVELSVVRAHGRSLRGPDPAELVGPVPDEWVDAVGDAQLVAWQALTHDAAHAELMVLTTCRVWRFGAERVHCSKPEAGRWALARESSLVAVREALHQRLEDPAAGIGPEGIGRLIALVRAELASR